MTTDASTQRADDKPADDFIALGGDDDFIKFDDASDAEDASESDSTDHDSTFHPHQITLATFRKLLACYPATVEQVYRCKMMLKLQPKPEKGSRAKAQKRAGSASVNMRGAALIKKTDFSPSEEKYITDQTAKFLRLDTWRYEAMPDIIAGRKSTCEEGEDVSLTKEELVNVMEWKTSHGLPRPTLMGMVKSNQQKNVAKYTAVALAALPSKDPIEAPDEAFPKASIAALDPLRGIGPATASLILSIATASDKFGNQVPFYSDDLYLWLCLKDYPEPELESEQLISGTGAESAKPKKNVSKYRRPNGDLNVKYNIAEYRQLWHAAWKLRQRLNEAVQKEEAGLVVRPKHSNPVSHLDIEKVAYVLRHIAVSGFYEGVDPTEIMRIHDEQEARGIAHEQAQKAAKAISLGLDKADEKKAEKKRKRQAEKSDKKGSRNSKKTKT
ncbi:hypothetical protein N7492_010177 [Penicillium capsulatum]|uniref:Uncharacterized protein n=1 Tax=Penicillium capsulatum TaxID=69766 RepID=A0A9W9LF13_9EURO|nr:hypothetical protein N7492_010177 [Penicillium capsulatum]KAJ6112685.1 hypothetical protein N7512_008009 [Penicillium capsulatum]